MKKFTLKDTAEVLMLPTASDWKYSRGIVGLLTGSRSYAGAAVLTVDGAARTGAGFIRYVGDTPMTYSLVLHAFPEVVAGEASCDAWVLGSGVSFNDRADSSRQNIMHDLMVQGDDSDYQALWANGAPLLVVDGGCLEQYAFLTAENADNSGNEYLPSAVRTVVTPNTPELVRMMRAMGFENVSAEIIESDRISWVGAARDALGCTVILKGAHTLIAPAITPEIAHGASPEVIQVTSPTYWLATAGSGDVLAGIMGTLLAQNHKRIAEGEVSIEEVVGTAIFLHGISGALASDVISPRAFDEAVGKSYLFGMAADGDVIGHPIIASDIAKSIPSAYNMIARFVHSSSFSAPTFTH